MKKVFFIGTVLLCGMLIFSNSVEAQSRKEKKAAKEAKKAEWEKRADSLLHSQRPSIYYRPIEEIREEMKSPFPCAKHSESDDEYFRMLGVGKDSEISIGREKAQQDAQNKMIKQIGWIIRGLVAQYCKSNSKIVENADLKGRLEHTLLDEISSFISHSEPVCKKMASDMTGERFYYCAVEIPKKGLVDTMVSAINGDENLKTVYDTEIFRQFAEEYLKDKYE